MKFVKYFLQKKSVTILLLVLVLAGGLFSYVKMGKLEDAPFTIKQALVLTPYPGASSSEVQSQVTDILEEAIQSMGELYYLKTENRAGLSKITVYVKKEIRADEMQQLWDKLRRKVNDVQSKLPAGAGPSIVNDDFGDVLGVFYGLTGDSYSFRELEDEAKLIKNELLKVKDVAKVELFNIYLTYIPVERRGQPSVFQFVGSHVKGSLGHRVVSPGLFILAGGNVVLLIQLLYSFKLCLHLDIHSLRPFLAYAEVTGVYLGNDTPLRVIITGIHLKAVYRPAYPK